MSGSAVRLSRYPAGLLSLVLAASTAGAQRPPASAAAAPSGDWPSAGRDPGLTRFSPLTRMNTTNVGLLRQVWTFETGVLGAHEGNPLVVGSMMFVQSPFPNTVSALDLTQPNAPPKWTYTVPRAMSRITLPTGCCDVGNRGLGYHPSGKIYVALLHGDLAALDAQDGREIWRVRNADYRAGATMPAAPVVVKDLVIVGTAGAEYGVRGRISAYEALTGKLAWRAYHTGPDTDILIEGEANPNYPSHRGRDLGVSTWQGPEWQRGGATASGWISYDPELDLIYYGTDHPGTYNASLRPGANKWGSSIFARSATTGAVRWVLQLTPHDEWGFDASNENILVDLTMAGAPVKALVHFDRNGFGYTIDRVSGRILAVERFGPLNWASQIDRPSGEPVVAPRYQQKAGRTTGICPAIIGAKGLQPAAFSPVTSLFYVPTADLCMDLTPAPATYTPGRPYTGATIRIKVAAGPSQGRLVAWDAALGAVAWQVQEAFPITGGVLATAGDLVFYGTLDGWLKAIDHRSGLELWKFKAPAGIVGSPITFLGGDGKQYLAVYSGIGQWVGSWASGAFGDLDAISSPAGVLLVFGL